MIQDQINFMVAGGQTATMKNPEQMRLYQKLMDEDYWEFRDSILRGPRENQTKAAVGLLTVTLGWLISAGVDVQQAWSLVHNNNMAKVTNALTKDLQGRIQKSPESTRRKTELTERLKTL